MNRISKLVFLSLFLGTSHILWAYEEGQLLEVGKKNPIALPFRHPDNPNSASTDINRAYPFAKGEVGRIYEFGRGLVKLVPLEKFESGDEIRVSEIAGDLKIAPKFYGAWFTHKKDDPANLFVAIEMELLNGPTIAQASTKQDLDSARQMAAAMRQVFRNRAGGETYFFDRLFSILKMLVERKIYWDDAHYGNLILPEHRTWSNEHMKIIDFDSAEIYPTVADAAQAMLANRVYIHAWIDAFENEPVQGQIAKEALQAIRDMAQRP